MGLTISLKTVWRAALHLQRLHPLLTWHADGKQLLVSASLEYLGWLFHHYVARASAFVADAPSSLPFFESRSGHLIQRVATRNGADAPLMANHEKVCCGKQSCDEVLVSCYSPVHGVKLV